MGFVNKIRTITNRAPIGRNSRVIDEIMASLAETVDSQSSEILRGYKEIALSNTDGSRSVGETGGTNPPLSTEEKLKFVNQFIQELGREQLAERGRLHANILFLARRVRGIGLRNWRRHKDIRKAQSLDRAEERETIEKIISDSETDTRNLLKEIKKELYGMRSELLVFDASWKMEDLDVYKAECFNWALSKYVDVSALSQEYVGLALIRFPAMDEAVPHSVVNHIRTTYRRKLDFIGFVDHNTLGLLVLDPRKNSLLNRVEQLRLSLRLLQDVERLTSISSVTILKVEEDAQAFIKRSLSELDDSARHHTG